MKRVLLTGASGSVGLETLKKFYKTDYQVTALDLNNRKSKRRLRKYSDKMRVVLGDINDRKLMEDLVRHVDVVIHLAAVIPPLADRETELTRRVNFEGTKNIVEAIKRVNPKCFLVFSSSVSVYGDRLDDYWIKVSDPLRSSEGDFYAQTKIRTEKMIRESGINFTIFRFSAIMGHPELDPLMFHMPLSTHMEIATTRDTGRALVHAVEKIGVLNGKIFNLGGGEKCRTTYREFLINMLKIYGLDFKMIGDFAFAEKNFHCGYFLDSGDLEKILHFQKDTLSSYYAWVKKETNGFVRFMSRIFARPIIFFLRLKSDPLKARKSGDKGLIRRFLRGKGGEGCSS